MKIKSNAKSIVGLGTDVQLVPGENEVPESIIRKWANDPDVRRMVEDGTLEVEGGPKRKGKAAKAVETKPQDPPMDPPPATDEGASEPTEEELAAQLAGKQ